MPALIDLILAGRRIAGHRPWPRAAVDAEVWRFAVGQLAEGRCSLLDLTQIVDIEAGAEAASEALAAYVD